MGLIFQKQDLNFSGVQNRAGEASTGTVCAQEQSHTACSLPKTRSGVEALHTVNVLHPGHNSAAVVTPPGRAAGMKVCRLPPHAPPVCQCIM